MSIVKIGYLMLVQSYVLYFEEKFLNSCTVASTSSTCNHDDSRSNPSLLRTPTIPRKSPRKRNICLNELIFFQAADKIVDIDSISEQNSLENFTSKRLDNSTRLFNLNCSEETGFLAVHECISAERNLHVCLSYHGLVIPLLQWFRYENNCAPSVPLLNLVCLNLVC